MKRDCWYEWRRFLPNSDLGVAPDVAWFWITISLYQSFCHNGILNSDNVFLSSINCLSLEDWEIDLRSKLFSLLRISSIGISRFKPRKPAIIPGIAYVNIRSVQEQQSAIDGYSRRGGFYANMSHISFVLGGNNIQEQGHNLDVRRTQITLNTSLDSSILSIVTFLNWTWWSCLRKIGHVTMRHWAMYGE